MNRVSHLRCMLLYGDFDAPKVVKKYGPKIDMAYPFEGQHRGVCVAEEQAPQVC